MNPKKYIKEANESYQQYQDGLITRAERLAKQQVAIQTMIEQEIFTAKNTLESFGITVEL